MCLLKKNTDPAAFEKKMPQLVERYVGPQAAQAFGTSWENLRVKGILIQFSIQNVTDIHLKTDLSRGI